MTRNDKFESDHIKVLAKPNDNREKPENKTLRTENPPKSVKMSVKCRSVNM